ncbi:MAG: hypothetical protein ACKESB_00640 [Candidatus Hodgkinia cicadicola]
METGRSTVSVLFCSETGCGSCSLFPFLGQLVIVAVFVESIYVSSSAEGVKCVVNRVDLNVDWKAVC